MRNASALGFCSEIVGKGVARTHALEALVVCSFLRGLSVRDVEAALEEAFDGPVVSKSTVSRICADTRERYRAWCGRRLDEHDLVYLFLDAVYLKLRPDDTPAEGVLVAWGVTLEGRKLLLGLQLGSRESYEDWLDFGRELARRRHDPARGRPDRTTPTKPSRRRTERALDRGGDRSLGSRPSGATPGRFHPGAGTPPSVTPLPHTRAVLPAIGVRPRRALGLRRCPTARGARAPP